MNSQVNINCSKYAGLVLSVGVWVSVRLTACLGSTDHMFYNSKTEMAISRHLSPQNNSSVQNSVVRNSDCGMFG